VSASGGRVIFSNLHYTDEIRCGAISCVIGRNYNLPAGCIRTDRNVVSNGQTSDDLALKRSTQPGIFVVAAACSETRSLVPNSTTTTRTPATAMLYNTTNGQKVATSQHLDMSRCWALALRCGKFVVQQVVELL